MTELEKLEALAKAATPGPWAYEPHGDTMEYGVGVLMDENDNQVSGYQESGVMTVVESVAVEVNGQSNAAFIAAANPQAILTLIQEKREMEEALKRMRIALEGLAECDGRSTTLEHANSVIAGMGKAAIRALIPGDTP